MNPTSPSNTIKNFLILYGFFLMFMYRLSYAEQNHQVHVQSHPATYFEQSAVDMFLDHEAIAQCLKTQKEDKKIAVG